MVQNNSQTNGRSHSRDGQPSSNHNLEPINHYACTDALNFLHFFILMLSVTKDMQCLICHRLIIDCSTLSCGHSFCKFCILSWLRLCDQCPKCLKRGIQPVSGRTYQIDSFLDYIHPHFQILMRCERVFNQSSRNEYNARFPETIRQLKNQISVAPDLIISTPQEREIIRTNRRKITKKLKIIFLSSPHRSIFDNIVDISFEIRRSVTGCSMAFIACFFFSVSVCYFCDILKELGLVFFRQVIFSILTASIFFSNRSQNLNTDDEERGSFWNQIVRVRNKDVPSPFVPEDNKMLNWIQNGDLTCDEIRMETLEILDLIRKNMVCREDGRNLENNYTRPNRKLDRNNNTN